MNQETKNITSDGPGNSKTLLVALLILLQGLNMKTKSQDTTKLYKYKIPRAGAIEPGGWIRQQLHRDLTQGYIGQYDEVHHTVTHDVFLNQNRLSKRKFTLRKEWWSGEHEGYWRDAIIRMAYLTDDAEYKQESQKFVRELLSHIDSSGYIGIYRDCDKPDCRFNHVRGNGELWTTSRMLMALTAYYEFTGDEEVLNAVEKATRLVMEQYKERNYFLKPSRGGGISHGIGFFENLEWLYRLTGNQEYLTFAEKLYNDFNNGQFRDDDLKLQHLLNEEKLFEKHGAYVAEGFFVPEFVAGIN